MRTLKLLLVLSSTTLLGTLLAVGCSSEESTTSSTPDGGPTPQPTSSSSSGGTDAGPVKTFKVTASIVGLKKTGLVLRDKSGASLSVVPKADGSTQTVTVIEKVPAQTSYDIQVQNQPVGQECKITGGSGTIVAGDVTSVMVNCSDLFTISGTVEGLAGKNLVLENSAGGPEALTINQNGTFSFTTGLRPATAYTVSIKTNPTDKWQTCVFVPSGDGGAGDGGVSPNSVSGTANADVTDLKIACTTNKYTVRVNLTGLTPTGTGAVLQNNGADDLSFSAPATKAFTTQVESGANYAVTVKTSPTAPWQTCTVPAAGAAKMAGADVTITVPCVTDKYTITATVKGLQGNGLVITNNDGDDVTKNGAAGNGAVTFATSIESGKDYDVKVKTQPTGVAGESCAVTKAKGTVAGANVIDVEVNCGTCSGADRTMFDGKCWTKGGLGQNCTQVCAARGGFNAAASQHTGNPVCTQFHPEKANGSTWVSVECCSTDNNTNWGANGQAPDPNFSHQACFLACVCNQ